MVVAFLVVVGLCAGSFVNALVWRLHEQADQKSRKKPNQSYLKTLSITKGRSICPNCHHELQAIDLIPVLSWLWLRGKCRYCSKPISIQYPLIEVVTALLFISSYYFWPQALHGWQTVVFGLWLLILTGLMALLVYDLRWMLLPNKLVFPLTGLALLQALINMASDVQPAKQFFNLFFAAVIGGGLFYLLFQVSGGRWIGGGDVKLGLLLGFLAGNAEKSLLFIFVASLLGAVISVPLLAAKRLGPKSVIPFGPFLIIGGILTVLFGGQITHWYNQTALMTFSNMLML